MQTGRAVKAIVAGFILCLVLAYGAKYVQAETIVDQQTSYVEGYAHLPVTTS